MTEKDKLLNYANQLIHQKKIIQASRYLLITSFIVFSLGILLALPLRYYFGINHIWPILLASGAITLSFVYGFLGLDNAESVFRQMDEIMDLNEKMSAVWQFGHSENPYSRLLRDEALELMEKIEPSQVFKIHFSRRDPFIPLLLALFLFLWLSSFSFLQISDQQMAMGDFLMETSERIDAVTADDPQMDLDEISEEYKKLGQKIQDRFMNEQSLENEVESLSRKLEEKIAELSREGVDRESKVLGDEDAESEIYQLERKKKMNSDLQDILESLMKTFSITPEMGSGGIQRGESGQSGDSGTSGSRREEQSRSSTAEEETTGQEDAQSSADESSVQEEGPFTDELQEGLKEGESSGNEPGESEGMESDDSQGAESTPEFQRDFSGEEQFDPNQFPGTDMPEDLTDLKPMKEERQSGEFDEDENIKGELRKGEQMKSFIRALPHLVEPTREEMDVIRYYRNQLESSVDRENLPEGYESVIRDYFLGIGVLKDE